MTLLALGLGLALAPAAFGMFSRAPGGGRMIDDFRPYMDSATIESFRSHLGLIGSSQRELAELRTAAPHLPGAARLAAAWPAVHEDLASMLDTIEANSARFAGLTALPPFAAFPWFFVGPGVALAGLAVATWRSAGSGDRSPAPVWLRRAVIGLGVGLVAAPFALQMFSRAPGGSDMIDDFRPLMTTTRITEVQQHFLTIAAGEGVIRNQILTNLPEQAVPETRAFIEAWPTMASAMAPMIGAMADNVGNFAGVTALPPFWLFPWFFVLPGLMAIGLGFALVAGAPIPAPLPPTFERSVA